MPTKPIFAAILISAALTGCRNAAPDEALARTPGAGADASASPTAKPAADVVVRRLWSGDGVGDVEFNWMSVHPDGRFVSFPDWGHMEIGIRAVGSGDEYPLTRFSGPDDTCVSPAFSAFSRDGRRVAYACEGPGPDGTWGYELRVLDLEIDTDGKPHAGEPRVIYSTPPMKPYEPFDWSPDGQEILTRMYGPGNNTATLALIASDGSSSRTLKSFDWRQPTRAKLSPDGRYVAYDLPPDPETVERDVFVMSVDGTQDEAVVAHAADDRLLEWHPDGRLLFLSTRGGTPAVWQVRIDRGRAAGSPGVLLADAWGHEPIGLAGDRYVFGVRAEMPTLYAAALDAEGARLVSAPEAIEDPYGSQPGSWAWAPDGRHVAYLLQGQGTLPQIVVRSVDGGEERRVRLDMRIALSLRWVGSQAAIMVAGSDLEGRKGFYRVDLETGDVTSVLRLDELHDPATQHGEIHFEISPDGGTIYLSTRAEDARARLTARDLTSGAEAHLVVLASEWPLALSRDGSMLAAVTGGSRGAPVVSAVPTDGGPLRELFRLPRAGGPGENENVHSVDWGPDGTLYALVRLGQDFEVWAVPADGRPPRTVEGIERLFWAPARISPDGGSLLYKAGRPRGEIWVMEGVASAP